MIPWIVSGAAFGLLFLFEGLKCHSAIKGKPCFNPWFFAGSGLLVAAFILFAIPNERSGLGVFIPGLIITIVSIGAYIRVLTVVDQDHIYKENKTILPVLDTGIYGVVRHPGLWCFIGLSLGVGLMVPGAAPGAAFLAVMNVVYIILQDRIFFPVYLEGYEEYRKRVPFCIPKK